MTFTKIVQGPDRADRIKIDPALTPMLRGSFEKLGAEAVFLLLNVATRDIGACPAVAAALRKAIPEEKPQTARALTDAISRMSGEAPEEIAERHDDFARLLGKSGDESVTYADIQNALAAMWQRYGSFEGDADASRVHVPRMVRTMAQALLFAEESGLASTTTANNGAAVQRMAWALDALSRAARQDYFDDLVKSLAIAGQTVGAWRRS